MHENKNDAPTSKVFYRPLEASIRWAGLLRYEQVILASVSSPMNLPQSLDCPRLGVPNAPKPAHPLTSKSHI